MGHYVAYPIYFVDPDPDQFADLEAENEDREKSPWPYAQTLGRYERSLDYPPCRVRSGVEMTAEEKAEIQREHDEALAFKQRHGGK